MTNAIGILLVEDTPSDVRLTQEALKASPFKFELSVVNDGVQAMTYLNEFKSSDRLHLLPSVILLDLNMPKKNGHEVLEEIKADPALRHIPVILLTVSERDEDIMEALKSKMNYYMAKPVTAQKLSNLVKAIYELNSPNDEELRPHTDEEKHIRLVLAGNPHTARAALRKLAEDESVKVRRRIAENPNTPVEVLLNMAQDSDSEVRMGLCENVNLNDSLLEVLVNDSSAEVRLELASNAHIPVAVLDRLASDENTYVSDSAKKTLSAVKGD